MTSAGQSMVERVSRAIDPNAWLALDRGDVPAALVTVGRRGLLAKARAAIEAMLEPSEAMVKAGAKQASLWHRDFDRPDTCAARVFYDMVRAALQPDSEPADAAL